MAVVVEQTIPFSSSVLDVENATRWNNLLPLIRPSFKAVVVSQTHTILVDTALANDKYVRVAAIGRAGRFSSKLLESQHVAAVVTQQYGERVTAEEIDQALKSSGFASGPGLIVVRSGRLKKNLDIQAEGIVEVEVNGDLELDHVLHILGTATEEARMSIEALEKLLEVFLEMSSTAFSTFHVEKAEANPAILHAEGSSNGFEKAKHAVERDLKHVMRQGTAWTRGSDLTYSVHYSDVNGLSRLENYILGLEIAKYLESANLPCAISSSTLLQHDKLARGFAISICPVPVEFLAAQRAPANLLADDKADTAALSKVDSRYMRFDDKQVRMRVENACNAVIAEEPTITRYDEIVGDGDCGYTLRDGAKQVLKFIANKNLGDLPQTLGELVHDLEVNMGGTSGALYCIFLTSLSSTLATSSSVADALAGAMAELLKYTRARLGDRTMLDCLIPFVETFQQTGDGVQALSEARKGVETTKNLEAKLGRSTYLDESATRGVPDPGAYGLLVLLEGMCKL
ncbi:hypothetical protein MBLNU459_g2544t1 [Dothideomycetes sp. NU459]